MKELQQKSDADLIKYVREKREELRSLRFASSGSGMRDARVIRTARKEIARTLTELNGRAKKEVESKS